MSYRLIDSNALAVKYPEVNDMPCVYADLPNGMNGQFIDAQPEIIRCKDCEHYVRTPFLGTGYDYGKCGSPYIDAVMAPDDYCSFGERRTE